MGRGKPEKYLKVAEKLREMIKEKGFKKNDVLPSERQMAAMFGVNQLTLRKSLRVLESERMIYKEPSKGNFVGTRPPAGKGAKIVSVLLPEHEAFYYDVLEELERHFSVASLHPLLHITRNSRRNEEEALEFADSHGVAAIVAVPNGDCEARYRRIKRTLVFFDSFVEGLARPHVVSDDHGGGRAVARHLLNLGHKAFAWVGCSYDRSMSLRLKGFADAIASEGGELKERHIMNGEPSRQWGGKAAEYLINGGAMPTGILCGNDTIAAGLLKRLKEAGIMAPKDFSVVGFGNNSIAGDIDLTSVEQHPVMIASSIWNILRLTLDGGGQPPDSSVIPTSLVLRGSSGKAP